MQLIGKDDRDGPTKCTTGVLDHADKTDFTTGSTAVFEGVGDKKPLSDCYLVNITLF